MKSPCIIRHISCHRYNRSILLSPLSLSQCLWQYSFHRYCCCRCGLLAAPLLLLQLQLHFAVCLLSVTVSVSVAVSVSVSFCCLFVCCCCAAKSILLHISLGDKSQTWQMMLPLICARNARTGHSAVRYNWYAESMASTGSRGATKGWWLSGKILKQYWSCIIISLSWKKILKQHLSYLFNYYLFILFIHLFIFCQLNSLQPFLSFLLTPH